MACKAPLNLSGGVLLMFDHVRCLALGWPELFWLFAEQVVRENQAIDAVRKRAKWIGQQVLGFWGKASRVQHMKARAGKAEVCFYA